MEEILNKLEELERAQDWHTETLEQFKEWRDRLNALEMDKNFLEMPKVQIIADTMKSFINIANEKLISDRKLNKVDRQYYFALKEIANSLHQNFSNENYKQELKIIKNDIDLNLKDLKNNYDFLLLQIHQCLLIILSFGKWYITCL